MKLDPKALEVTKKQASIKADIGILLAESELTDIEQLQILTDVQATVLKYALRFERHGNYDTPAMEVKDES